MIKHDGLSGLVFLIIFGFTLPGSQGQLVVSAVGPSRVDTTAGSNLTLVVSFSGAPDPAVTWFKGPLPVITWIIGSNSPPDVAPEYEEVLRLQPNGSLGFVHVPLNYGDDYSVEMTKSGLGTASVNFTLRVFESFQNVTVTVWPDLIIEGSEQFLLKYSMLRGVLEHQLWFFNGRLITPEDGSRYSVRPGSIAVREPHRNDTGRYTVSLSNPFSSVTLHQNVTILYGPDEPRIQINPLQDFYISGDSLTLSCQADGSPQPLVEWKFAGETLTDSHAGVLNLSRVLTSQGGVYTCELRNQMTGVRQLKSVELLIYERPSGSPRCSVLSNNNRSLRYECRWSGGTPPARLSFPDFGEGDTLENLTLTVNASGEMDGKTVTCQAQHPVENSECNVTARSPQNFLPTVRTNVDPEGQIVVSIGCLSRAEPPAVVSWFHGGEPVSDGNLISDDTTRLDIRHYNVSVLLFQNYTCSCRNPLGGRSKMVHLQEPSISDFSLFPHKDGTIVTLTWEIPPTSIVTGFDIQMSGPRLVVADGTDRRAKGAVEEFRTILRKPGSARSADVFHLNPKSTYRFRVLPRALMAEGQPSKPDRAGPLEVSTVVRAFRKAEITDSINDDFAAGLSGPAVAGIAAGIPCGILFLLLLCGLICSAIYWTKTKMRQTRYPVTTPQMQIPHNVLPGPPKSPPDYNRLRTTSSVLSVAPPSFVPPPPVRVATTV